MRGCLSVQVLQEFYVAATQKVQHPVHKSRAGEILRGFAYWRVHAPVAEDVLGAVDLQQRYMASFWDAMIIWSAEQLGCRTVWLEDLTEDLDYGGVGIVNPFRE